MPLLQNGIKLHWYKKITLVQKNYIGKSTKLHWYEMVQNYIGTKWYKITLVRNGTKLHWYKIEILISLFVLVETTEEIFLQSAFKCINRALQNTDIGREVIPN